MSKDSYSIRFAISLLATISLCSGNALAKLPDYLGQPLVDLIDTLRNDGQRIAYSRELLPARLVVTVAPEGDTEFEALREILLAHGLDLETGPSDTWLIVRSHEELAAVETALSAPLQSLVPPMLDTIVVTASRYPIERQAATSASSFGRHTIETTPALGQDPLRITHRLPGVSSDQLTSRMHIRGGNLDEVLLRLDGIRLYSPYHLKDFQNVFSSINPDIVQSMEVRTGGFEARFGDKMSGVIDLRTAKPTEFRHHELTASLLSTSALSSGLFASGKGAWLTSIRRGNLDVLADIGNSGIGTPQYVDFFNRVDYSFSSRLDLETGYLSLDDKIDLNDGDEANAAATYADSYFWVNLHHQGSSGLDARYQVSSTNLNRIRTGTINDPGRLNGTLFETSKFDRLAVTADWTMPLLDHLWVSWGAEYAGMDTRRTFRSDRNNLQPIQAPQLEAPGNPPASAYLNLAQTKHAYYASVRYRPITRMVTELGMRWDSQSVLGTSQSNPRLNLRFDVTQRTRIRAAWGEYSQSDSLAELAIADGITALQPTQASRHVVLGLEHAFGDTGLLRIEAYRKQVSSSAVRFENVFERISLLPELLPDRFRVSPASARVRGFEISIEGSNGSFGWWANLAISRASETLASGEFRSGWDETRSTKAGGEWSGTKWTVTTTLGYRRGWPISSISQSGDTIIADQFNALALPDFSSVDVRASRSIATENGSLEWFMEVSNLANHPNYCCLNYSLEQNETSSGNELAVEYDELFGIVPNTGMRWQF